MVQSGLPTTPPFARVSPELGWINGRNIADDSTSIVVLSFEFGSFAASDRHKLQGFVRFPNILLSPGTFRVLATLPFQEVFFYARHCELIRSKLGGFEAKLVNDTEGPDSQRVESDEQLMAAFSRGSAEAFSTLFQRYKSGIFGFFCRRVKDRSQAEELTQDTFLALLRAHDRYQPSALFRTWLYAVALNILRAHRRKTLFRALFSGQATEIGHPSAPSCLDTEFIFREAVGKLEAADREVLLLREFEELSYAEIAMILHIPINTVRSRLFRARTALRDLLASPLPNDRQLTRVEEHP